MNRKQEIVIWAALIIIQLMIIFPPIRRLEQPAEGVEEPPEISVVTGWVPGYGIIIRDYKNIRFIRLAVQLIIAIAVTCAFIYTFREKEREEDGH